MNIGSKERAEILRYVQQNPGAQFDEIVRHLLREDNFAARVLQQLEDLQGDHLREVEGGGYRIDRGPTALPIPEKPEGRSLSDPDDWPDEPDAQVPYVREIEVWSDAEDAKVVRFSDGDTAVQVGITDECLPRFVEVAERVFDSIHLDMAEMEAIMSGALVDDEDEGR